MSDTPQNARQAAPFQESLWAKAGFAEEYRDNADHYIQDRSELFRLLKSFSPIGTIKPGRNGWMSAIRGSV